MERSNPEFPKEGSQELNEQAKEKLRNLERLLTSLYDSLSKKDGAIKSIYAEIIKQQRQAKPDQSFLNKKKLELITVSVEHKTPLLHAVSALPEEIKEYFKKNGFDLMFLSENLIVDVGNFKDQVLTKNPEENAFRVSVWMNKISLIRQFINPLLKKENA